jgi:hypothetical protein
VYEVCNLDEPLCSIYYRTSADGWDYGDPFELGTGVRTADGKYPRHTPTIDVTASGLVLLVSERVWREIPAPVQTPGVNNEGCRNFSPALLVAPDDQSVLEITTDFDGDVCKPYYASGPIA